jgi:hypothetical protein
MGSNADAAKTTLLVHRGRQETCGIAPGLSATDSLVPIR